MNPEKRSEREKDDRVGHIALGAFPVFIIREILLRVTPLQKGGWFYFIVFGIVLAIAAFWELLEWWVALFAAPRMSALTF